jgi:hypothetical protein
MTAIRAAWIAALAIVSAAVLAAQNPPAPKNEDCAGCHDAGPRTGKRQAGVPPGYHAAALKASPHASLDCTACHADIKEVPHADKLGKVDCGMCHPDQGGQYTASVHGKRAAQNDAFAPNCKVCHGTHDVLPPSNLKSPVATINVPSLCGRCHAEGTEVSTEVPRQSGPEAADAGAGGIAVRQRE